MSPSLRGRGLKYIQGRALAMPAPSPSLRGRGLKSNIVSAIHVVQAVALFARAWIEIACMKWQCHGVYVALFARAWIEISDTMSKYRMSVRSPSLRGRGLKSPRGGPLSFTSTSPSLRGRGLKYGTTKQVSRVKQSRPLCEGVD